MRRLHGADRRRCTSLMPDAGRDRRRPFRGNARRDQGRTYSAPAATRLHGAFCRPMRLLHAGHADGGKGPARPQSLADPRGGRQRHRRQHLPLHRIRTHHQGRARRRIERPRARLEDRVMLELRKDIFADERDDNLKEIGKGTQRQDMLGHVTGTSTYFNDHKLQGMLHLKILRSPHAHARIRHIDTVEAERFPGVRRIIRGADVPRNLNTLLSLINFGKDDEPTHAVDKVRYKGEPVVAVVADSEREASEAIAKLHVDYEALPTVFDVEDAIKPGAPVVNETYPKNTFTYHDIYDHQKLRFGDVERGFASADHVIEHRYQMSPIEHAPTETNGSIAAPDTNGRYVVYTSTQALFFSLDTCAKILDVPSNTFHFIGGTVGGGFGGKVDTLTEPLAILGAMLTGRPVRYIFGREEEVQYGPPRGAERIYLKDGVMRDGRIVARRVRAYFDSGAYTRLSSYAVVKCAAHLPGPYTIPNVYGDIYCIFTNRTPATSLRGFGVPSMDFAIKCQMDKLAHLVGMDPMEFRILNAYRDGDMKAHRREAKNTALIECVQVAAEKAKWPLREEFKRMSSRKDGGGTRAAVPATATDLFAPTRPAAAQQRTPYDRATPPGGPPQPPHPPAPPVSPPPAPQQPSHGAIRFSSVFGSRRR